MTHRIFIANRGEIAVRVIEACDRLGFETVLGVSRADTATLGARRATRTVVLGGPQSRDSYLSVDSVVHAAIATGCTALHPGYGFLSERADLARACAGDGIVFIGPSPEALEALGDKLSARAMATRLGVPVSPGGTASCLEEVERLGAEVGFPVLVKAAHGGGGRGMKLVTTPEGLAEAWSLASSEAETAFGDGTVFLERYVADAKHIEVQVLGDRHGRQVHLGERECSVQYRYQKVVEESPCAVLDQPTRDVLTTSALAIARELEYVGLGTVEFLYDVARREVAFLEVNPRLQVEHPVTEQVTGIDLVREQILVALGEPLSFAQEDVTVTGHAIECRITAQDPARGLLPSPGPVTRWRPPVGGGIRLDSHIYQGYDFPPYYDALMAKLIAWGPDRDAARTRMEQALAGFGIDGLVTSRDLLARIVAHPDFADDSVTTHWLADTILTRETA
ncbi:acetyl-CoA carboxylase biotin carboxylase subunit [Streptomyces tagetis]|uniref:biotin carboxylase n=1 Tax=Streptomyces tagetis TaxID=2820809 RepID=A0A940XH13_9ACTN|nr:biotin carboxylase N-terminal domain-containing protein [Streptomyces sp. RG38]MBQ0828240.1 ATP-grasp domain-containing protein [Streptomyces sp. RG38]